MSFGTSAGDAFLLAQLGWKVVKNARQACGEHASLTLEVSSLHAVLGRLQQELKKPESPLHLEPPDCIWNDELQAITKNCQRVLRIFEQILNKYNALSEKERSGRKLWQKIRFGNGEMMDLQELRNRIILYTSSMNFHLNLASVGTVGKIEQEMSRNGGILKEIQHSVNNFVAQVVSNHADADSVLTDYTDDNKDFWKDLRRELCNDGFSSSVIHQHKRTILNYIKELASRGVLDDQRQEELEERNIDDKQITGICGVHPRCPEPPKKLSNSASDDSVDDVRTEDRASSFRQSNSGSSSQNIWEPSHAEDPPQTSMSSKLEIEQNGIEVLDVSENICDPSAIEDPPLASSSSILGIKQDGFETADAAKGKSSPSGKRVPVSRSVEADMQLAVWRGTSGLDQDLNDTEMIDTLAVFHDENRSCHVSTEEPEATVEEPGYTVEEPGYTVEEPGYTTESLRPRYRRRKWHYETPKEGRGISIKKRYIVLGAFVAGLFVWRIKSNAKPKRRIFS